MKKTDEMFLEYLKDACLIKLLNNKGRLILGEATNICFEKGATEESKEFADKIFDIVEGKRWIPTLVAIFFVLDMLIQNNPIKLGEENDKEEIDKLIMELENKMKKNRE
jgi:hypothetical protein